MPKTGIKTIDFNSIPNMAFTKPVNLSYLGNSHEENSWRILYVDLCKYLIEDYPEIFKQLRQDSMSRKTKLWLVDDAHTNLLIQPKRITGNYHIETNCNASKIIRNIRWLLTQCSVDYRDVVIRYISNADEGSKDSPISLIIKRKYNRDDKEGFYQWLLKNYPQMGESSCQGYVSAVRSAEKYAEGHSLKSFKLFGVTADEAKKTADALFSDPEFVNKNQVRNNCFGVAITKLLAFLEKDKAVQYGFSSIGKVPVIQKTETIRVDMKPFEAVLTQKFSRGYKLGSLIDMKKFCHYFEEINGYLPKQAPKDIEKIILLCGIEHKGKVYTPQSMLSDDLHDKLFDFIDKSFEKGKTVIYFESLFDVFSEKFLDHNIYNAEMLKAYIVYMAEGRYFITKNYLSNKKGSSDDPIEDVRTCLKEHVMPMKVEELCKALSHIPSERIRSLLSTNSEFVMNAKGEYFHIDSFSLSDEELESISDVIEAEIKAHTFISGNELYSAIRSKYPYIQENYPMFSVIGWRDTLKFRLSDKFSFSGNIITCKDKLLSMGEVFANFGAEHESFTLQELLTFAVNMGTTRIYFDSLYQSAARISQDIFVSKEKVSFQVKETDKVLDRFCTRDYLALPQIKNFGIFPEASHPWTLYLLEHYLAFHSDHYYLMHGRFNQNFAVGAMVKKRKSYKCFDDLIVDILAESGVPLSEEAALNYLCDNGYIARRSYNDIDSLIINARVKRNMKEK